MMSDFHLQQYGIHYIEVNLSVVECIQNNLTQRIFDTLRKYMVDPSFINLEITETATDSSNSILDENIRLLHEKGIGFSLDDYGTGYSSLNRILSLPLEIIKLDKTIVQPAFCEDDQNARTVLECSVDMAKRIGAKLVAEGVESEECANGIISLGCDYIQGYYYSKPLPLDDFVDFVNTKFRDSNPVPS